MRTPSRESVRNWAIATLIVFILGAGVLTAVRNTARIKSIQSSATANRVANVLTWCRAINEDRVALDLPRLDCHLIAYKTAKSNH